MPPQKPGESQSLLNRCRWCPPVMRTWGVEIAASISSTLLTVVTAGVLFRYGDDTLDSWTRAFQTVSPNTYISVLIYIIQILTLYATAQTVKMLSWLHYTSNDRPLADLDAFEGASRQDIVGAACFMITSCRDTLKSVHRFFLPTEQSDRHLNMPLISKALTALASILIVSAAGFGPFAQRSVSTYLSNVPDPSGEAQLFANLRYNLTDNEAAFNRIDHNMQGAIFDGLYGLDAIHLQHYLCSTGNCTWPAFTSVGELEPVLMSFQARHGCRLGSQDELTGVRICQRSCTETNDTAEGICATCRDVSKEAEQSCTQDSCQYESPSGMYLERHLGPQPTRLNITTKAEGMDPLHLFALCVDAHSDPQSRNATLTECDIHWCAKRYSGYTYKDGKLKAGKAHNLKVAWNLPHDYLTNSKADIEGDVQSHDRSNLTVLVSSNGWRSSQSLLTTIFDMEIRTVGGNRVDFGGNETFPNATLQDDTALQVWSSGSNCNVTKVVKSVAQSMSNYVRNFNRDLHQPGHTVNEQTLVAGGVAWTPVQHVGFEWPWMLLPLIVIIAANVHLFLVIVMTRHVPRERIPNKASVVPLVLGALEVDRTSGTARLKESAPEQSAQQSAQHSTV